MITVRQFLTQCYRLISAANPTQPLHGDDLTLGLTIFNQLLQYYASTGLLIPIAKTVNTILPIGTTDVLFTEPDYTTVSTLKEVVTLTTGSPNFTVADSTIYFVGDTITGAGVPTGTTIQAILGNLITMSANATLTGSSAIYITHDSSEADVVYIKEGRLANLDNAWLLLDGVTYPLIYESRTDFLASFRFNPLQGLPRFVIVFPEVEATRVRVYPSPSQPFDFYLRGKFQLNTMTTNDSLSDLPEYQVRYLMFAVAKDIAMFKGRMEAWTPTLEQMYIDAKAIIEAASETNVSITGTRDSLLNGAYRVRAGV